MQIAAEMLPDDPAVLKAMVLELQAQRAERDVRISRLTAVSEEAEARYQRLQIMLKTLLKSQYGKRSEKLGAARLDDDQLAFLFEEIETGLGEIQARLEHAVPKPERPKRVRKALPAHLERIEVVLEPEALPCGCGACEPVMIGEDVSERLDVTPARFCVIVTRRPKYACKACQDGVAQAPAPDRLIEGGLPTERLLAHIAVSKYADALPLYRQEAIYARDQVELSRGLMADWMGRIGFHLEPLADRILDLIRNGERVFADETKLPRLAPGSGKVKIAWLWTYLKDDRPYGGSDPPMVAYRFEDSRGGPCVSRHLAGFSGLLQVDGYAGYNAMITPGRAEGAVTLACCWSHLRRYFYKLHAAGVSRTATETVHRMAGLWAIEAEIRGHSPIERVRVRQERSAPIVAGLWQLWEAELPRIPGSSKLAEAIRYGLTRREAFNRFLADGRIDLDNNHVERAIRPQTITRKNALFAGSEAGGQTWATIATLLATCRLNDVNPQAWLTQTLERIAQGWPQSKLDELLPWNYRAG